ncbi:MAG: cupin domain-containing protein [Rhodospirillaceae bacterium]
MDLNADFSQRAAVHFGQGAWKASPMAGVDRHMLDRIGDEVARATSIVRYAPGSAFSAHTHGGGEEYLVLEGVFQDEHGDFPVGSYVRNPPTSAHIPRSDPGSIIFVKLWQFDPQDRQTVRIDSNARTPVPVTGREGVREIPLYADDRERVRIEQWAADQDITLSDHQGLEILVLGGDFEEGGERFSRFSWLRLPPGQAFMGRSGGSGAQLWIKSDHLAEPQTAPQPAPNPETP